MQLNLVDTKVCGNCKIEKKFEEFSNSASGRFNLRSYCKICHRLKVKEYQELNKEKVLEYQKEYYELNKEKVLEKNKKYYELNKEKIKKYYELNKEKILEYGRNYKNQRRQTDSLFKFRVGIRNLINGTFKRGKNKYNKNAKTEEILGCTIDEFRLYIQSKFTDGMTFENHGEWHLDHIKPISLATTEEEIIELNHYTNFQPLWAKDNLSKSNKYANTRTN